MALYKCLLIIITLIEGVPAKTKNSVIIIHFGIIKVCIVGNFLVYF